MQVGKHGLIIEFTDPDYNIRRSATYLPEVASHEGECLFSFIKTTHFVYYKLFSFYICYKG